jgi:uncharacterized protein YoxC
MADADALKETLDALADVAPRMGETLAGLAREAASAQAALAELVQRTADREREAAALLAQIETALGSLRGGAAPLELHTHDPAAILGDPGLSFDEKVFRVGVSVAERQEETVQAMARAWQARTEAQRTSLGAARLAHPAALRGLQAGLEGAHEVAVVEVAGLRGAVLASRDMVDGLVDRMAAESETQRTQATRDLEELRKDVLAFEEEFAERLLRARQTLGEDTERMAEETASRLDDLHEGLARALEEVTESIRDMSGSLRRATDEAAEGRRDAVPLFDDVDSRLAPLRRAIESVRDAARSVGIPF